MEGFASSWPAGLSLDHTVNSSENPATGGKVGSFILLLTGIFIHPSWCRISEPSIVASTICIATTKCHLWMTFFLSQSVEP